MTKSSNDLNSGSLPSGVLVEGSVLSVPITLVRPFADQPRHHFCQVRLMELAGSIKEVGQLVPVEVRQLDKPDADGRVYELVDGQRRWHACQLAGLSRIRLTVVDIANQHEQFVRSIVSNFGRAGHTPMETCAALCRLRDGGMTQAEMAKMLGRNVAWVCNHLSLGSLVPEAQAMMNPDHPQPLGIKTGVMISALPPDVQRMIVKRIGGQSGRTMTEAAARMAIRAAAGGTQLREKGRPQASVWHTLCDLVKRVTGQFGEYSALADLDYRTTLAQPAPKEVAKYVKLLRQLAGTVLAIADSVERNYPDPRALRAILDKCHGGHDDETTKRVGGSGVVVPVSGSGSDDAGRLGARDEQPV